VDPETSKMMSELKKRRNSLLSKERLPRVMINELSSNDLEKPLQLDSLDNGETKKLEEIHQKMSSARNPKKINTKDDNDFDDANVPELAV
jgi:hypothetical protein